MSFQERVRRVGRQARTAFRHARVWLWRFKRSPEQQDRATMFATYAVIAAFAVGSVDAIVTGGADFGPSPAYAEEFRPERVPSEQSAPAQLDMAPVLKTVAAENVDYSFTAEVLLGGPEELVDMDDAMLSLDELMAAPATVREAGL